MTARTLRTGEAAARGGDLPRHALLLLAALLAAFLTVAPRAEAFVYWTSSASIGRANLDGTWPDGYFIPQGGPSCGVAVDGTHVYWANPTVYASSGGSIGRANLDGTGAVENFIPIPADVGCGVAVDGAHVYWATNGHEQPGRNRARQPERDRDRRELHRYPRWQPLRGSSRWFPRLLGQVVGRDDGRDRARQPERDRDRRGLHRYPRWQPLRGSGRWHAHLLGQPVGPGGARQPERDRDRRGLHR